MNKIKYLITGVAGFIGFNFAKFLLLKGCNVYGIDNLDHYYSVKLKKKRLNELKKFKNFKFYRFNIEINNEFNKLKIRNLDYIYHFAAQAGVRYSVINPEKYINTNILGTINVLKYASNIRPKKIFFASSSSVYGDSKKFPLNEKDKLYPKNIYASSKIINEISAKKFSEQYKIKMYGLRFFTVYGEWGRPDMLLFKIIKAFKEKKTLKLNNSGNHYRDFTYINDVLEILFKLGNVKINKQFDIFNICSNNPQFIKKIIDNFSSVYGKLKVKNYPKNKLDVFKTHGNNNKVLKLIHKKKFTDFDTGLKNTFEWYKKMNSKLIY